MSAYVDFLLAARRYDLPSRLRQITPGNGERHGNQPTTWYSIRLRNEPLGSALYWTIHFSDQFETARDVEVAAAGWSSLRIRFHGQETSHTNTSSRKSSSSPAVSIRRFISHRRDNDRPGVGFQILGRRRQLAPQGRNRAYAWNRGLDLLEESFTVPPRTRLLEIRAFRRQSRKFDSKISGRSGLMTCRWFRGRRTAPRPL